MTAPTDEPAEPGDDFYTPRVTKFGFVFGGAYVMRACSDRRGSLILIRTKRHGWNDSVQISVTPGGRVRVFGDDPVKRRKNR